MENKIKFMQYCLSLAQKAYKKGEVPIGAVVVKNGKIISKYYNRRQRTQNAVDHAELRAIEIACKKLHSWRLDDCELYVTLEPCVMCAGAICNARIKKVYFGAYEKKSGAIVSRYSLLDNNGLNYNGEYEGGILEDECSGILKSFFKNHRK